MSYQSSPNTNMYPVKCSPGDPRSGWYPRLPDGMDCESLYAYERGELCPIIHDDILSGPDLLQQQKTFCSFRIIGKLGHGSYSTVWLGKDLSRNRYLALKVLQLEYSTIDNSEMRILRKLERLQVAFFHTHPPDGFRYLCLGLEPLGSSLSSRDNAEIPLPSNLGEITKFMRGLIGRVIDLHQRGICHGDISAGNVAFGLHKDAFTPEALKAAFQDEIKSYTCFSGPEDPPPALPPNLPKYIVQVDSPALLTDTQEISKVDLLDFGQAFEGTSKEKVYGTTIFLAPELQDERISQPSSTKTDLWSLGCVIVSGLTRFHLFERKDISKLYLEATEPQEQLNIIFCSLVQDNSFLDWHHDQCWLVARIVHSLVQVNPSLRDVKRAMQLVDELESSGGEINEA